MRGSLFLCACLLALSGCGPAAVRQEAPPPVTATPSAQTEKAPQAGWEERGEAASPPLLVEAGEACGTDGKPACPLVKPTESMTPKYDRTPEQLARMEAFDQLTLAEKFIALDQGLIVCTEFIHDEEWEHQIDGAFIELVGREKFDQWTGLDDGCHSIYNFANAFLLTYEDLEKVILEKGLDIYPLDGLKAGMEKWGGGE